MRSTTVLAIAMALAAVPAHAYVYCDDLARWSQFKEARKERHKAFGERRFEVLDRHFTALLAAHEARRISDAEVAVEFNMFASEEAGPEPLHAEWVGKYPKSRAARLAHAVYWTSRGYGARGGERAVNTSEAQMDAMRAALRKAMAELDVSESMAKRPTPEWARRIRVLMSSGAGSGRIEAIYSKAIADFPETLAVRTMYGDASMPQWGGSFERIAQARRDAESLPPDDRRYVQSRLDVSAGFAHRFLKDNARAAQAYERAMPACPVYYDAADALARIYSETKNYPGLVVAATRFLAREPQAAWMWRFRGWAHGHLGKLDESFHDFGRAAELGDGEAMVQLAAFHEKGLGKTTRDPRRAIELYMGAHSRGVAGAKAQADRLSAMVSR